MKRLLILTALLPFAALTANQHPEQPEPAGLRHSEPAAYADGDDEPATAAERDAQSAVKDADPVQQQHLQNQMNTNTQRVQQGQMLEQPLPNANGGMLEAEYRKAAVSSTCCRPSRTAVCLINKVRPDLVNRIGTDAVHAPAQQLGCTLGFVDGIHRDMQTGLLQQRHARFIQQLMVEVDRHAA